MKRDSFLLLLLLLLFLVTAPARSQSAVPLDGAQFLNSSPADLITRYHLHKAGGADATEIAIGRAVSTLHSAMSPSTEIWVCHGCGTAAHPTLGIIVDVDQLLAMQRASHVRDLHWLLVFVLAHEYGHRQQFQHPSTVFAALRTEEQRVYEAQADMLGSEAAYNCLPTPIPPALMDTLGQVERAIYNSGGGEYALADHPSRAQRLLATQMGLVHATAVNPVAQQLPNIDSVRQSIDLRDDERALPYEYTLRMARAIVQSNHAAARDLVWMPAKDDIAWDTSDTHPVVSYSFRYQNRGTRALVVRLQVKVLGVDRQDPENPFKTQTLQARFHRFRLEPGASSLVRGELNWYNPAGLMPKIIYPPDPFSLVEVHYADGSDAPEDEVDNRSLRTAFVSEGEMSSLSSGLTQLVNASFSGYAGIAAGVGRAFTTGSVDFPSNFTPAGFLSATISMGAGKRRKVWGPAGPSITSTLEVLYDERQARAAYQHLVDVVRATLPTVATTDGTHLWSEGKDDNRLRTRFAHAPFGVEVEDWVWPEKTGAGPNQTVDLHHIQLTFHGQLRHRDSANSAGSPYTEVSGSGRDPELASVLALAAEHRLGQLESETKVEGTIHILEVKGLAARFGACELKVRAETSLWCTQDFHTLQEAQAFARTLEVAALNAGATLDYAITDDSSLRVRLWGTQGSSLELRVWLATGQFTINVQPYSPDT